MGVSGIFWVETIWLDKSILGGENSAAYRRGKATALSLSEIGETPPHYRKKKKDIACTHRHLI